MGELASGRMNEWPTGGGLVDVWVPKTHARVIDHCTAWLHSVEQAGQDRAGQGRETRRMKLAPSAADVIHEPKCLHCPPINLLVNHQSVISKQTVSRHTKGQDGAGGKEESSADGERSCYHHLPLLVQRQRSTTDALASLSTVLGPYREETEGQQQQQARERVRGNSPEEAGTLQGNRHCRG